MPRSTWMCASGHDASASSKKCDQANKHGLLARHLGRRVHLPHMDVQMPWAQDALERPCTRMALEGHQLRRSSHQVNFLHVPERIQTIHRIVRRLA